MNATGKCSLGGANLLLPVLLVAIMLTGNASAAYYYDRQSGSDYDSNDATGYSSGPDTELFYDCSELVGTNQYTAVGCNDDNSIIVGAKDDDDSYNDVIFEFTIDKTEQCLYNEGNATLGSTYHGFLGLRFSMDYQTNGPTQTQARQGWVGGSSTTYGTTSYKDANQIYVYAWDYSGNAGTNSNWDLINANNKTRLDVKNSNNQWIWGTIPTINHGEGSNSFSTFNFDIPIDGDAPRTQRNGKYVDSTSSSDEITVKFRLRNSPKYNDGQSGNDLRTEIRNLNLSVRDEEIAPNNPSNTGDFSSVSGNPDFVYNYWTTTDAFKFEANNPASDSCDTSINQNPSIEYAILPLGTSPNSGTSFSTSTDSKLNSDIYIGNTSGQYKLWYRAVDSNSNRANWTDASYTLKLDLVGPNSGNVVLTVSQANNNWFNETHLPTFSWQGWTDSHSGVNNYSVKVNSEAMGVSINHVFGNTHSWSMSSSDLSQLNLSCQTHDFTVVAYDKAQTVDSTGSPLQNPTPNSREKKTTFNYDDCNPNPPELVSSETWYNSGNPNLEIVVGDDTNSFQSGISYCTFEIAGANYTITATTCSDSSSNNAFSIPLSDGVHTGVFTACDLAGNCNSSDLLNDKRTVRVDTVAPADNNINIISPTPDYWTNSTSASATLTFEDPNPNGVTISEMDRVYSGFFKSNQASPTVGDMENNSEFSDCSTNTCSISFNQTLSTGNWTLWYYAVDNAGNTLGPLAHNQFVLVDLAPPVASQPYFASSLTNESNLTLLWSSASDIHSGVSGYYVNLTSIDSNQIVSSRFVTTISTTISNLSDGNYSACIVPVDNVGNTGNSSCTYDYARIDTVNPIITAWSNVNGWTSNNTVVISWSASDDSQTAQVRYLRAGSWSQAFTVNESQPLGNFSEGIHQIIVKANDSAGNVNQTTVTFGIDYSGPSVLISSNHGSSWTNQSTHIVSWNVTDMYSGVDMVDLYVNGVLEQSNLSANDSYNIQFDSGQHNITLVTVDNVGNYQNSTIFTKVDLATPDIVCTVNPASWSSTMPSVQYTISNNGSISNVDMTVQFDGNPIIPQNDVVTLPQYLDGIYNLVMKAENQGGNFDICSQDVYVDSTSPSFTAIPTIGDVVSQNDLQLNLSLQDIHSGLSSIEILVDDIQYNQSEENFNSHFLNLSVLSQGSHEMKIIVQDNAGNQKVWTKDFIFDTISPTVEFFSLTSSLSNGWLNQTNAQFSYSVSDDLDDDLETDIFVNSVEITHFDGSFTIELNEGSNEIMLVTTDHGGLSTSTSLTVAVDSQQPSCVINSEVASHLWSNVNPRSIQISPSFGYSGGNISYTLNGEQQGPLVNSSILLPDGISTIAANMLSNSGISGTCILEQRLDQTEDVIDVNISTDLGNYGDGIVSVNLMNANQPQSALNVSIKHEGSTLYTYRSSGDFSEDVRLEFNSSGLKTLEIIAEDDAGNIFITNKIVEILIDDEVPESDCDLVLLGDDEVHLEENNRNIISHNPSKSISIVCTFLDNSPINLEQQLGALTSISINNLTLDSGVKYGVDSATISLQGFSDTYSEYYLQLELVDMWGNDVEISYNYYLIDYNRAVEISTSGIVNSTVNLNSVSEQKLGYQINFAYEEPGCTITIQIGSYYFVEDCPDSANIEGYQALKHENIFDLITQEGAGFEEGKELEFFLTLSSDVGDDLVSSKILYLGECDENYEFNISLQSCVQVAYNGISISQNPSALVEYNVPVKHQKPEAELTIFKYGSQSKSTCVVESGGEMLEYDSPENNSFVVKVVESDGDEILVKCTDEGGFIDRTSIKITWTEYATSESNFFAENLVLISSAAAAIAIVLLFVVVIVLRSNNLLKNEFLKSKSGEEE